MLGPFHPATRTRYLVAEILVVLLLASLLVVAYRIDAQWISRHVILLNLWPPRDAEAWSRRGRGLLVILATLLVLGLRPALRLVASKGSLAGLARSAAPALLAIAAAAVIAEGLMRRMRAQALRGREVYQQRGVPHPRYGWTWQPSSSITERALGRDVHWAFNREGFRVEKQDDEPDPDLPTILFTGESIALGLGLNHAETYPALIAARRPVQCVNLAANAYGSAQAYLRLIDAMPRFRRLVATVTLFLPVQLGRNLQDDRPRLVLGQNGELELVPAASDFLSRLRIRRLLWNELPYLGDRGIDRTMALTAAILRETSVRTRARGATPLFVIPSNGPKRTLGEHPEAWILRELFVQQQLPFILVDLPPDQLLKDSHPGPRGDETIAAAILAALPPGS
jgi:hypothetical protein